MKRKDFILLFPFFMGTFLVMREPQNFKYTQSILTEKTNDIKKYYETYTSICPLCKKKYTIGLCNECLALVKSKMFSS